MDIQYNRNEDYKTIILPNSAAATTSEDDLTNNTVKVGDEQAEQQKQEMNGTANNKPNATLLLNDEKEIETTVIFVPNVWSLMPNSIEYQKTVEAYKNFIDNPPVSLAPPPPPPAPPTPVSTTPIQVKKSADNIQPANETSNQAASSTSNEQNFELKDEIKLKQDEDEDSNQNAPAEVNSIEDLTKSLKALYKFLIILLFFLFNLFFFVDYSNLFYFAKKKIHIHLIPYFFLILILN